MARRAPGNDRVPGPLAQRPDQGIGERHRGRDGSDVLGRPIVDDVDERQRSYPRGLDHGLDRDQPLRHARADERVDHDRIPALIWLRREMGPALHVPDAQSGSTPQPQVLAGDGEHVGVDLAHLLASTGIRRGKRSRERASAAADMQHAARTGGLQRDPQPAHVVELEVRGVGKIHVRGFHAGLPQESPRRPARIHLGDQVPALGEGSGARLSVRHTDSLAHR